MRTLFFVLFVVTTAAACSATDEAIEPTFDNVYQVVLEKRCTFAACHSNEQKAAELNLTKEAACRELVNKPSCLFPNRMRIIPGHPEESFFFHKLSGEGLSEVPTSNCSGETNALMPYGGSELPESEMQLVNAWIAAGASCDPGMEKPDDKNPMGPAPIVGITASTVTPVAGESITFTINLARPAPVGGQTIRILPVAALYMPSEVSVDGGESIARFEAYAARPASRFMLRAETGADMYKELAIRVGGLSVAEVLSDPVGSDDNFQWIKLRNLSTVPVDLSTFRLSIGQASYDFTGAQLSGSIPAGGCLVVGGPSSGYQNGEADIGLPFDFSPDLPNTGAQARGYAITDGGGTPVDTMLVGTSNAGLLGVDGDVPAPFCGVAPEGMTVKRTGAGTCVISEMRPNQCP